MGKTQKQHRKKVAKRAQKIQETRKFIVRKIQENHLAKTESSQPAQPQIYGQTQVKSFIDQYRQQRSSSEKESRIG